MKRLMSKGFTVVEALLIVVILGLIGGVGYYVYQAQQDDGITENTSTIVAKDEADEEEAECVDPSAADVENIKAAITSGNTAALEGYMADTVNVIFAASEGLGDRTAAEATADVTSFIVSTSAWDFDLDEAEMNGYETGDYKQYFPTNTVVGKSAENKLIAFRFNCDGDISGIFVANNSEVL